MRALTTDQVRRTFLDYFKERGHAEVPSSSLVPQNDPTLLFTNAGMVQFKDVFTGKETRAYDRATSSQKCVRAGGKHNDLENVGVTPRHHTFFEMLGNFAFGSYFKAEAIAYAWELVVERLGVPKDRLCVTVFAGEDGIPADEEAAELWKKAGVPADRIFRLGKKDNYWQMGDTGPQGPCSEIHYFMADDVERMFAPGRVERSDGWLEIWNLVFMQFVRETVDGPLLPLPKPCVDTGAGLERLAMVLQGKRSTFETDLFSRLLVKIAEAAGKTYGGSDGDDDVSMRVIADHARATAFLIADGVQPLNEGRGYVLRRIMRRAIRHGRRLGFDDLFFHRACLEVVDAMAGVYPELRRAEALVRKVAENEEAVFRRTLDRGLALLKDEIARARDGRLALPPAFVANLYDTYGFPIDLTRVIASEEGLEVNEDEAYEEVRRRQAKGASAELSRERVVSKLWFDLRERGGETRFLGYEHDEAEARVCAIVGPSGEIERAGPGQEVEVVLDRTPFYGESGGQIGDAGEIAWSGGRMKVTDTKKPLPEIHAHVGLVNEGVLEKGASVRARVDAELRNRTRKNHSSTHLLHLALKEVLGAHVQQKGSLVAPDRLRFDYSHFEPLTQEECAAIEDRVNVLILENAPTETVEQSLDEAESAGAVMLFGEKYGESVRSVRIGGESLELCGGTHVRRAGDIGFFKIVSDGGLASGVRRIEALTGLDALHFVQRQERALRGVSGQLKVAPDQVGERVEKLVKRTKELEQALEEAQTRVALGTGRGSADQPEDVQQIAGIRVLFKQADGTPKKSLRPLADRLRDQIKSGVVIITAKEDDQVAMLVAATKDLAGKVDAGKVLKEAMAAMGGSGGGRPDFAQGGAPSAKLDLGLERARAVLETGASAARSEPKASGGP